jgi:hypothetical protein
MNKIDVPLRLLYYLNLSREDQALKNIITDTETFQYFVWICGMTRGQANAKQNTKKILKTLKGVAI